MTRADAARPSYSASAAAASSANRGRSWTRPGTAARRPGGVTRYCPFDPGPGQAAPCRLPALGQRPDVRVRIGVSSRTSPNPAFPGVACQTRGEPMTHRSFTRRDFLATAAVAMAAAPLRARQNRVPVTLSIPAVADGPHMPQDFVGLSYEVRQLTDPSFFSARNSGLIRAFREISEHGVLRLGGNTSEFGYWKPTADSPEPEHPPVREVVGEPKAEYLPGHGRSGRQPRGISERDRLVVPLWHRHGHQHAGPRGR